MELQNCVHKCRLNPSELGRGNCMSATGIDKILILSHDRSRNKAVESLIVQGLKHPHAIVEALFDDNGMREVRKGDYGLLILITPLDNDKAFRACRDCIKHPTATMILITDDPDDDQSLAKKERFLDVGVCILHRPVSRSAFLVALKSADTAHIRLCTLNKKVEEEKVIARSKIILVKTLSLTEDEAHKFIEKEAMNSGQTKLEVAMEIIRTYDYL